MYSPPGGGIATITAADATATVGGTPTARTVAVAKQLDSTYLTDFAAAVGAQLANLTTKQEVAYATAAALPANTYVNGAGTLTGNANGALAVDGQNVAAGQRILAKNEATTTHNGIYVVTATGGAGAPYVLTRAADYNTPAEIGPGDLVPVAGPAGALGATLDGSLWISSAAVPFVIGVSAVTFLRIGAGAVALTTDSGVLTGADINGVGNAWNTILTSASLAVGTWLVTWQAHCAPTGTNQRPIVRVAPGTATATIAGPQHAQSITGLANQPVMVSVTCLVTVTVAGTLLMQARDPDGTMAVAHNAFGGAFEPITGYTAVKIA